MDHDELAAWLRLTLTPGVGNSSARKLLAAFGLPQRIFEQSGSALRQIVSANQAQALGSMPEAVPALTDTTLAWLAQDAPGGIRRRVATLGDPHYPPAFLNLDDPPLVLYLLGRATYKQNAPADHTKQAQAAIDSIVLDLCIDSDASLAMVGSRNPTPQGAANARLFAKSLAASGLTIVSGLALGVDGASHEGALEAATDNQGALTVAVVGTGLDRVYPRAHRDLAHRIAQHGVLISEYPLGTPPLTANFPKRNRLIAGLARATLVVEAALKSGSLITARLSSEQGKDVFAIPGSIHAAQSRGCHALIKQGAKLAESAQDILEELAWSVSALPSPAGVDADTVSAAHATAPHDALLQALGYDVVGLDALQARTGLPTSELQAQLLGLELDDQVARLPGGLFQRLSA